MTHAAAISFKKFRHHYNSGNACRTELFRLRFSNGFVCPKFGCVEYYPIKAGVHASVVPASTRLLLLPERSCTTHLPLAIWFWAIYLCATNKRGISAVQLSRTLGICYDSAWYLLNRIRTAMGQRDEKYLLSGIVESYDGYVGGPSSNGKRGPAFFSSTPVDASSQYLSPPVTSQPFTFWPF